VQLQIKPKSQFEFALRDTEKSEFLVLVVIMGGVAISVENGHELADDQLKMSAGHFPQKSHKL